MRNRVRPSVPAVVVETEIHYAYARRPHLSMLSARDRPPSHGHNCKPQHQWFLLVVVAVSEVASFCFLQRLIMRIAFLGKNAVGMSSEEESCAESDNAFRTPVAKSPRVECVCHCLRSVHGPLTGVSERSWQSLLKAADVRNDDIGVSLKRIASSSAEPLPCEMRYHRACYQHTHTHTHTQPTSPFRSRL